MKIALVSPYDFAYPGGVANHISSLEHYFTRMGHEVRIIAPASSTVSTFGDRFIAIGTPRPVPSSGSIARITISPWLSSRIKAVLDEEKFDIIHLHEPLLPMLCTTVLRLSHTANVGTFHASGARPWYEFGTPLGKLFLKKWFRKLDGKIAVSKPAMEYISKYFSGYYNIIPNGVDVNHFSPNVSPIDDFGDGKLNILFVGRLEKRKGADYLLDAYKRVKGEIPNSRLIIVGPGTRLRKKYERQVTQNGLDDVVFAGYVSYDELPRYYKTADIVCSPATGRESFGIVLLEAMAVGKPVVASNIEGYASVVTHGVDGLLVPPKDGEMLAQALISLVKDESLRQQMGAKGRLKASDYSWEHVAQKILDYYVRVLSEPPWKERFSKSEATSLSV
ncbi:Phosphatidyl-myo-inositol mannosyltransferase [subsurface metagenome]